MIEKKSIYDSNINKLQLENMLPNTKYLICLRVTRQRNPSSHVLQYQPQASSKHSIFSLHLNNSKISKSKNDQFKLTTFMLENSLNQTVKSMIKPYSLNFNLSKQTGNSLFNSSSFGFNHWKSIAAENQTNINEYVSEMECHFIFTQIIHWSAIMSIIVGFVLAFSLFCLIYLFIKFQNYFLYCLKQKFHYLNKSDTSKDKLKLNKINCIYHQSQRQSHHHHHHNNHHHLYLCNYHRTNTTNNNNNSQSVRVHSATHTHHCSCHHQHHFHRTNHHTKNSSIYRLHHHHHHHYHHHHPSNHHHKTHFNQQPHHKNRNSLSNKSNNFIQSSSPLCVHKIDQFQTSSNQHLVIQGQSSNNFSLESNTPSDVTLNSPTSDNQDNTPSSSNISNKKFVNTTIKPNKLDLTNSNKHNHISLVNNLNKTFSPTNSNLNVTNIENQSNMTGFTISIECPSDDFSQSNFDGHTSSLQSLIDNSNDYDKRIDKKNKDQLDLNLFENQSESERNSSIFFTQLIETL